MHVTHVEMRLVQLRPHVRIILIALPDMNISGLKTDPVGCIPNIRCASNIAIIMRVPHALTILSKELVEASIGEMAAVRMVVDVRHLVGVVGIPFFIRLYVPLMHNAKP